VSATLARCTAVNSFYAVGAVSVMLVNVDCTFRQLSILNRLTSHPFGLLCKTWVIFVVPQIVTAASHGLHRLQRRTCWFYIYTESSAASLIVVPRGFPLVLL